MNHALRGTGGGTRYREGMRSRSDWGRKINVWFQLNTSTNPQMRMINVVLSASRRVEKSGLT